MKRQTSHALLGARAVVSALGVGAALVILHQIPEILPRTSRRTELVFVLILAVILLLWSLTEALIQLIGRHSSGHLRGTEKSSQSATRIPLSTDTRRTYGKVDWLRSQGDQEERIHDED